MGQMELEKQAEQQQKATEQQRRQEREAAERLQRQEQEEQERRRRESEEQRLAQEEARRRAMEQADQERRRSEQERRLYEARERTWQDDQRRRVDEQRRMQQLQEQAQQQQQQQQQQLGSQDQVRSQLLTQEATMRQASEAAKLRRQQEEELERQRERERERAARIRLEELDRKRNGALGPASLGGDSVMRPPVVVRSAWGSTDSVGVGAGGAGNVLGSGAGLLEVDYAAMPRGRGAAPKEPRKLYDHKTDKFVSEDEKAWKGLNRPPTADKGASKGSSEKSNNALAVSSGKDSRADAARGREGSMATMTMICPWMPKLATRTPRPSACLRGNTTEKARVAGQGETRQQWGFLVLTVVRACAATGWRMCREGWEVKSLPPWLRLVIGTCLGVAKASLWALRSVSTTATWVVRVSIFCGRGCVAGAGSNCVVFACSNCVVFACLCPSPLQICRAQSSLCLSRLAGTGLGMWHPDRDGARA